MRPLFLMTNRFKVLTWPLVTPCRMFTDVGDFISKICPASRLELLFLLRRFVEALKPN